VRRDLEVRLDFQEQQVSPVQLVQRDYKAQPVPRDHKVQMEPPVQLVPLVFREQPGCKAIPVQSDLLDPRDYQAAPEKEVLLELRDQPGCKALRECPVQPGVLDQPDRLEYQE
jgi:hypothetical protein